MSDGQPHNIAALRAGDRYEFARLVEDFSPKIYRLLLKMLGNEPDAEDALQETFLKALRAVKSFEERSSLSTWLYRIAVNEALMAIRRRKPDVGLAGEVDEDEDGVPHPVELTDWCCLPEDELVSGEGRHQLNRAVQTLSPALRAVFLLRDVEGLAVRDTAETLGVSEQVVKTRLLRARLKLREELASYWSERLSERKSEG
jgi:RNA polymerase sigma-70 factor (ECF subfamily)